MCVGKHLAKSLLWLAIASMLSVMDIRRSKNAHGEMVDIPMEFTSGLIS